MHTPQMNPNSLANSLSPADFQGWERYPLNLRHNGEGYDLNAYHRRLQKESQRLFDPVIFDVCIETVLVEASQQSGVTRRITDRVVQEDQLEVALSKHLACHGDHYVFLHQRHTWTPLCVSETGFRKIVTVLKVGPSFLDVVRSFGRPQDDRETEQFFGGCNWRTRHEEGNELSSMTDTIDISYNVHNVVRTGRDEWPWSVRKTGIFHRYQQKSGTSTWIILQPTPAMRSLPNVNATPSRFEQLAFHNLILHMTLRSWTPYLQDLDFKVRKECQEARLDASHNLLDAKPDFDLAFSEVQILQYERDLIRDVLITMASEAEVVKGIKVLLTYFKLLPNSLADQSRLLQLSLELDMASSQITLKQTWAADMLERAQQAGELITALLNYKNTQALIATSVSLAQTAAASQKDSQNALLLSKAMKSDSSMMRLLATATIVYMPGTFVATLFSTGFVNAYLNDIDDAARRQTYIQASAYASVTVLLTIITVLAIPWLRKQYTKP